jgi:DNA-directed RNA polymerase subunit RPC12/RpoP
MRIMANMLTEGAIINALHKRRKMNESYPTVPYEDAPKPDEKYKVTDTPKNPAGTGVEPYKWTMDNFVSKCPNCGAFFTSEEDMSDEEVNCPECRENVVLESVGEIVSARLVECGGDPNDGVVYSLAADVDDIVDDDDLVDSDDFEDDYIEDDDIEDDDIADDEDEDEENEDDEVSEGALLELKIKRKAIRGGKVVKLDPETMRLKIKRAKRGKGFKIVNGKIKKMSAQERIKRSKAMKKVARRASVKNKRRRSNKKAQRLIANLDLNRNIIVDEYKLMDSVNEALDYAFSHYEDYIPFELVEVNAIKYDPEADMILIESTIRYEDDQEDSATFEINGALEGDCELTESSGEIFDLPVRITASCDVIDNEIIID